MIRKSSQKNKVHLIPEEEKHKDTFKNTHNDTHNDTLKGSLEDTFPQSDTQISTEDLHGESIDKEGEYKEAGLKSKLEILQNQIKKDLTNKEENCEDLDGWDTDI